MKASPTALPRTPQRSPPECRRRQGDPHSSRRSAARAIEDRPHRGDVDAFWDASIRLSAFRRQLPSAGWTAQSPPNDVLPRRCPAIAAAWKAPAVRLRSMYADALPTGIRRECRLLDVHVVETDGLASRGPHAEGVPVVHIDGCRECPPAPSRSCTALRGRGPLP